MSSDHIMNPATWSATRPTLRPRALLGVLALSLALAVAMPGAASAKNIFTLDTNPASGAFAAVAVDGAGTGYFAWEHNGGSAPNVTMFCKVARGGTCTNAVTLPTPPPGFGGGSHVDAGFPVLGSGSTVYVVGPRFIEQDVVVWTSTDGGVTFGPAAQVAQTSAYMGNSSPTDVLAALTGGFYVSTHNPGLSFISVPASGAGPTSSADLTPPGGLTNISDSTLGLAGGGTTGTPVEAFSMLNGGQPQTINFRVQSGAGDPNDAASWGAASQVTSGILPSLAGGPSGLFLASEDTDAAGHYTQVHVRKYTAGAGFGAPVATLQSDTSFDNAGRMFQTPGGRLLVAWPGPTASDGVTPIRLYDSTDGGKSFPMVGDVAAGTPFNAIYQASIRIAAADSGFGYVSFNESGGGNTFLRVADLTPIAVPASVQVAGIIFVGGTIVINAGFNTPGSVLVTSQISNASALAASAHRCKAGQVLLKVGNKKKCVSNSFGTTTKNIPAGGTYKIKLAPNAAARKALNKGKTLHVSVTLTFKPAGGGKPVAKTQKITVKGKKH
jgi:hypothetical protein